MATGSNDEQAEFWNGDVGAKWVALAAPLAESMGEVAPLLLASAAPRAGERVLDVGCGGGEVSLRLARAVGPGGEVLGVDVSAPLLALARRRGEGVAGLSFREGDAQAMDLPPGHFDLLVSHFGSMFFADPVAAFRNLGRALRPGGRVRLAAWGPVGANPYFHLPRAAALAVLGDVAMPPVDPLAPGPFAFADGDRVAGVLAQAGLAEVAWEGRDVTLRSPEGIGGLANLAMQVGPLPRLLAAAGATAAQAEAVRAAVGEALAPYPDGLPARVNLFAAVRP